jgi:TrpR family transcriptional regulator, trp operon repressor
LIDFLIINGRSKSMDGIREISRALSLTDDVRLIEKFLKSLLTENELREISSRWELVKMLDSGVSQRKIAEDLGISLCKITRGSRELKKSHSAFKQMIDKNRKIKFIDGLKK